MKLALVNGSLTLGEPRDTDVGALMFGTRLVKFCGNKVEDTTVVAALGDDDDVMALDEAMNWIEDVLRTGAMMPPALEGVSRD